MRLSLSLSPLALALLTATAPLLAATPALADDGYCDHVQGVAAAESAISLSPEVFAQFGRIDQAFEHVRGETIFRALEARAKVLEEALPQAEKMLAQSTADFEARRSTAQEATATRVRVEDLRRTAMETRRAMRDLPQPSGGDPAGALGAF